MKKLLLIAFVFLALQAKAQETYINMLDSNVAWYQVTIDAGFPEPVYYYHNYFIDGDTIINDTAFYKLFLNTDASSGTTYSGYIREDAAGKVYMRFTSQVSLCPFSDIDFPLNQDLLLLDFSVNLHDTIDAPFGWDENANILIEDVDSILINGTYRKKIWFGSYGAGSFRGGSWIEGIGGDIGGLFNYWCDMGNGAGTDLLCYVKNDDIVYSPGNNCLVGINEYSKKEIGLKLNPNPAYEVVNISVAENVKIAMVRVYEVTGRIVLVQALNGLPLGGGGLRGIDVSDLKPGIYLIEVETREGLREVKRVVIK